MSDDNGEILDALAWASLSDQARIARLASKLVGLTGGPYGGRLTKSLIEHTVRGTKPPHGRGKLIIEGVTKEIDRQLPIWRKRRDEKEEWERYQARMAERATRLNLAYAARFDRPPYEPHRPNPYSYNEYDAQVAWQRQESERDKGDRCIGLLIYKRDYIVALLSSVSKMEGAYYIAVRNRHGGDVVYTALRQGCEHFVDAIVSLGGNEVRWAMARGHRVDVDWVARNISVHYQNKTRILPWRTLDYVQNPSLPGFWQPHDALVIDGEVVRVEDEDRTYPTPAELGVVVIQAP